MSHEPHNQQQAPVSTRPETLLAMAWQAPAVCLVLDYDGTLVPLAARPELAAPDAGLLELLGRLGQRTGLSVHLVSGRAKAELDSWFGELPVSLHAEHGVWSRMRPSEPWLLHTPAIEVWPPELLATLQRAVDALPDSFVEHKSASLVLHYRQVPRPVLGSILPQLRARLAEIAGPKGLRLVDGAETLELRGPDVSKGNAVLRILQGAGQAAVFAFGDDVTDEDMFAALPHGAIGVRVGAGDSRARFRMAGPPQVRAFLAGLL
jgi:trehalose 6-phosphate synthase/phosphatase